MNTYFRNLPIRFFGKSALICVNLWISYCVWLAAFSPAICQAATPAPPLHTFSTIRPDAVGNRLQQSMIWMPPAKHGGTYFVAFRKTFNLPASAVLNIFADTRYMLWVNGRYVDRGPARFQPNGPEYDTIDLSGYAQPGRNSLVVLVMANASGGKMMRHVPCLTALLSSGGATFATDETWKWSAQTRYRSANVGWPGVVDQIDARVEDGDWTQPGYDDSKWQTATKVDGSAWGTLTARRIPRLRETPVQVTFDQSVTFPLTMKAGDKIAFTCPHMVQAYTRIELEASPGAELDIDHAKVKYVAKSGTQRYITSDTAGVLKGSLTLKSGQATIHKVDIIERLYPFDVAGSFHCDDDFLNSLWVLCARSGQLLSEDSFVDCADRERVEWMDDDPPGFDIVRTALAGPGPGYADPRIEHELIRRTALTLQPEGWVKAHTCSDRYDIHAKMEDRACDWVEGIRRYYEATRDAAAVREIWPAVIAQLNYFLERRTGRGLVLAREWVVWGNPMGYIMLEGAGLNAFVYKALVDAAYLGNEIGERDQAAKFAGAAKDLAKAYNDLLWDDKESTYYSGYFDRAESDRAAAMDAPASVGKAPRLPITNNLVAATVYPAIFALDQGIVPPERLDRLKEYLLTHRAVEGRIMTYYYLDKLLYAADTPGLDKAVLDNFRKKWQEIVSDPNICSWEEFHGGSHAHIYGMYPGYFLSAYALGVRRDEPVWNKTLLIEPHLGDLKYAEGKVVTEYGPVAVSWKSSAEGLGFSIDVPAGITATLALPDDGRHRSLTVNGGSVATVPRGHRLTATIQGHAEGSLHL